VFSANKSGEYYGYGKMASGIDENHDSTETALPPPTPSTAAPLDRSVTIPTPATQHAPKGYVTEDSTRGTIFWEAESDDNAQTRDLEADTSIIEAFDLEAEKQSLGHPFKIEWLSTEKLPFHRARGLRNPWNHNREVKIARDGTEIEPTVGWKLVHLFHTPQTTAPPAGPQLLYPARNQPTRPAAYPSEPRFGPFY
jgi:YT521-B-like domain